MKKNSIINSWSNFLINARRLFVGIFFLLMVSLVPLYVYADTSGLIPCGNTSSGSGTTSDMCTYSDIIILANAVIKFLIFDLAAPIGAIMFAYAGFTYVTNGGNESKIKQAHDIFLSVFWGLVVALSAWLLINFILSFLVKGTFNFLG
jgi:hypothetical protein